MSDRNGISVQRLSLDKIEELLKSHRVYPVEPFMRGDTILVQAGLGNELRPSKIKTYRGHKEIKELIVVGIHSSIEAGRDKGLFEMALEEYILGDHKTANEIAASLREKAREAAALYKFCAVWLEAEGVDLPDDRLDPDLANHIRRFVDSCVFMARIMKHISKKHIAGDTRFVEALRSLTMPTNRIARLGMKCGIEILQLMYALGIGLSGEDRLDQGFLMGFFALLGLWPENAKEEGHAARGAAMYRKLRLQTQGLPDIEAYIRNQNLIDPGRPHVFIVQRINDEAQNIGPAFYRSHKSPAGAADLEAEMLEMLGNEEKFTIEPAPENFATDLTILNVAIRFITDLEDGWPVIAIIENMANQISDAGKTNNLAEVIRSEPSIYSRIVGTLARTHKVFPQGAIVKLETTVDDVREQAHLLGVDGGLAICLGQNKKGEIKGLWLIGHASLQRLLPEAKPGMLTKPMLDDSGWPCQRFISQSNTRAMNTAKQAAMVLYCLPRRVFDTWLSSIQSKLIAN